MVNRTMRLGRFTFVNPSVPEMWVVLRLDVYDKIDCVKQLVCIASRIDDTVANTKREILTAILERERLGTTGIGNGVAMPHAKLDMIDHVFLFSLLGTLSEPIEFDSIDESAVDIVALWLASEHAGQKHLKGLARVSRLLRSKNFCASLRSANSIDECGAVFNAEGQEIVRSHAYEF